MTLGYFLIKYGNHNELEVIVNAENKEIGVTQATLRRLLGWDDKRAPEKMRSKSLKAFTGEGFATPKSRQAKDITGRKNKVKVIPFDFARLIIVWDAVNNQNPEAIALLSAGFADSFTSLALEQAGIQVTTAERQENLVRYLTGYHKFFDWVRDHYESLTGRKPDSWYYAQINMMINEAVCQKNSFSGDRRKNADNDDLFRVESFQRYFMEQRASLYPSTKPLKAVEDVLELMYKGAKTVIK